MLSRRAEKTQLHEMDQLSVLLINLNINPLFVGTFENKISRGSLRYVGALVLPTLGSCKSYLRKKFQWACQKNLSPA